MSISKFIIVINIEYTVDFHDRIKGSSLITKPSEGW